MLFVCLSSLRRCVLIDRSTACPFARLLAPLSLQWTTSNRMLDWYAPETYTRQATPNF